VGIRRPSSAEQIRDLAISSEIDPEYWNGVEKMIRKRPPNWKHFNSGSELPNLRDEIRAAKLQQYKRSSSKPPKARQSSKKGGALDMDLLQQAMQYADRTTMKINSSSFVSGVRGDRSKGKGRNKSRGRAKGKGRRKSSVAKKKGRKMRRKPASAPSRPRGSIDRRLAGGLERSTASKSKKAGRSIDVQALIDNFQSGSTLQKLKKQLQKSKQSKSESEQFIASAKSQWLA